MRSGDVSCKFSCFFVWAGKTGIPRTVINGESIGSPPKLNSTGGLY